MRGRVAPNYVIVNVKNPIRCRLKYEGFSVADATYAVDAINPDWNKQAAASAKRYLETTSFSRSGLIEQLKYEGFTEQQAVFGVNQTGL